MALAIYHDPNIWFDVKAGFLNPLLELPPEQHKEVVGERKFELISVQVQRDGLFVFDFSHWSLYRNDMVERRARQIQVMNLFLFCFYNAVCAKGAMVENEVLPLISMMRAEHRNVLSWDVSSSGGVGTSSDFERMIIRRGGSNHINLGTIVPEYIVDAAFDLYSMLSEGNNDIQVVSDLLFAALVAHFNLKFAEALGLSWLVVESLLNKQWESYLQNNRKRGEIDFINKARMDKFINGRDYSASVQMEILSLLDEISFELYSDLTLIRKVRNEWIHNLKSISIDHSTKSLELAVKLFKQNYKYPVNIPVYTGAFTGGGAYRGD